MNAETAYPRNPVHLVRYMSNAVRAALALSEGKSLVLWEIDRRFADIRKAVSLAALMVTDEHPVPCDLPTFIWQAWDRWEKIPPKDRAEAWKDGGLDLVFDSLCEGISGGEEFEKPLLYAGSHVAIGKGLPLDFAEPGDDVIIRKPREAPWAGVLLAKVKKEENGKTPRLFLRVLDPASNCELANLVEPAHVGLVLLNIQQRIQFRRKER